MIMKKTEEFIDQVCQFLSINKKDFEDTLVSLRAKGWERWGGGTVEVTVGELLYVITMMKKPSKVLEAGTSWGYSTAHIAEALKDIGKESEFLSLDISEPDQAQANTFLAQKNLKVQTVIANSTIPRNLNSLDMIFIDSSHDYHQTKLEWKWMYPLLFKNKGFAIFHDAYTETYGVKKFLLELQEQGHKLIILDTQPNTGFGIILLADEFIDPRTKNEIETDEWLNG